MRIKKELGKKGGNGGFLDYDFEEVVEVVFRSW